MFTGLDGNGIGLGPEEWYELNNNATRPATRPGRLAPPFRSLTTRSGHRPNGRVTSPFVRSAPKPAPAPIAIAVIFVLNFLN